MALKFTNSQEFLNKLQLFINVCIGIPMLAFIVLFLRIENKTYVPDILDETSVFYLRFLAFAGVGGLVALGLVLFNKRRNTLEASMTIRDKLEIYYSASVIRSYYFLAATVISLIGLVLAAEQFYVIYYTICLVAFSTTYPTIYRINRQLRLNRDEREVIISRKEIK
jgi:hypothetical protein